MNDNATPADPQGPLSPENYRQLAEAQERAKKLRKAAGVASFNGWSTAIFAGLSAPFALFSVVGFIITLGLTMVAWNEFRGRARLLKFDPTGPTLLGWNQLGFLALIVGYCCWSIYAGQSASSELTNQIKADPQIAHTLNQLGDIEALQRMLVLAVYGTVIVLSIFFQGLTALYYFSRRKIVASYVQETPAWVLEVQRGTAEG
jgi:hypothetical protein